MPRPSKVMQLPEGVRQELDNELVDRGFADYEELAAWLQDQGYEISKSSLGRYGKDFKERLGALRLASAQAKEIVGAMGDDAGAMGEALTSVAQEKAFKVLMSLNVEEQDVPIDRMMKAIGKLGSTDVQQKKLRMEVREKARKAAEEVDDITDEAGLSDEAAASIREKILGIAG